MSELASLAEGAAPHANGAVQRPEGAAQHPEIAARFAELHPAYDRNAAVVEADRCLYCFDAPCTTACPTHIDVPAFIKKIASGNLAGSARVILDANILGASCARACPVEVLCEGACVLHRYNRQPIHIGRLQRFAMENLEAHGNVLPFVPGADTGWSVALIGAGPASLACAAELRRRGVRAVLYDARALPGGLNTYGIAEYKLTLATSVREIERLAQLGVEFHLNTPIDAARLAELAAEHDAVFLGVGLGAIRKLGIGGETMAGVTDALTLIAQYKSGALLAMAGRVAVIGAGNTAIDAAIASVRLGAREVYMLYRRGPESMSAFASEYEHAKQEGVKFLWHVRPTAIVGETAARGIRLMGLASDGALEGVGSQIEMQVEHVVLAIGQGTHTAFIAGLPGAGVAGIQMDRGRIVVDRATGQTSRAKYFAGGDCTNGGREVVDAVAEGKRAGIAMAAWLEGQHVEA